MDDDRIDFSSLDPKRHPARFERMVEAVVAGAAPPAARPHPLLLALVGSGRTVVACAVLLAAASWLATLARSGSKTSGDAAVGEDPVAQVSAWAETGRIPPGVDLLQLLGGSDAR